MPLLGWEHWVFAGQMDKAVTESQPPPALGCVAGSGIPSWVRTCRRYRTARRTRVTTSTRDSLDPGLDALSRNGVFGRYVAADVEFHMPDVGIEFHGREEVLTALVDWRQNSL